MIPYDPTGPLPPPATTTLLEASAGTGKTHTIAALAARLIAEEGLAARDLLIVTFSRSATAELRERIRSRLRATLALLEGERGSTPDDVDRHLLGTLGVPGRERIRAALADFDAASISTVHTFCGQAMRYLGVLGDAIPGETHLEDLSALVGTATADTFLRLAGATGFTLTPKGAAERAARAVGDSQSRLEQALLPAPEEDPDLAQEFARRARDRAERIRRRNGWVTYDDLITRLTATLTASPAAAEAVAVLRQRYPVVLVDEFQDTDEAQWAVLEAVFHGHSRLVLIGDPKQAIYAFRGGDVHTYARAAATAAHSHTLATNYRSDKAVVDAVNLLFSGRKLGEQPEITAETVAAHHEAARLTLPDGSPVPACRGRILDMQSTLDPLRARIAADTAEQIAQTLRQGLRIDGKEGRRPVDAGDIAVLTRTGKQADMVGAELAERGIPHRLHRADNVLGSHAARDWLTLLRALAEPGWPDLGNAAALALLGGDPADLAADPDAFAETYGAQLRSLRQAAEGGFPAVAAAVLANPAGMAAVGDDRRLTDLRHVAELLGEQHRATGMPLAALADWLSTRIADAGEEHPRRRETEEAAVVVMTVHASKGLQFPIVHVPFAWEGVHRDSKREARFHRHDHRVLDVRTQGTGRKESLRLSDAETDDEEVRLLYVALTRAVHQVVWHWAWGKRRTDRSALHRVLGAAAAGHATLQPKYGTDAWRSWAEDQSELSIEDVPDPVATTPQPTASATGVCQPAVFARSLDRDWSRRSYSSLTRTAHEAAAPARLTVDEPDDQEDEGAAAERDRVAAPPADAVASPWGAMPGGTAFGTLVHSVLEETPGDQPDRLPERCAEALARYRVAGVSADEVARALGLSMSTPLGSLVGDADLTAFGPADRAAELDFEIALDTRTSDVDSPVLADLAHLMAEHLPGDHPLAAYPDRLRSIGTPQKLRGFLSGSIDAVLRWHSPEGPRYVVVDYKTNWLGPRRDSGIPLTAWHYRPEVLPQAMMDAHYPLQALLYSVALHRHLRFRLGAGYRPQQHLGGALYLYLRGMVGPTSPPGSGVFSWQPGAELIARASDLLSGGAR